jgi:hypothetical protein
MTHSSLTDDGIGRLLVASLHQAIGDAIPMRLDYYEHWLGPMGLRDGRTGLAPLGAVLSFLRLEGQPVYDDIMTRAGRASAEWHLAADRLTLPVTKLLPAGLRARYALGRGRRLVRAAFEPARARVAARKGLGHVDIDGSVFCTLRDPWPWPTCTYFAAAIARHLELCGAPARVRIDTCRARAAGSCRLGVDFGAAPPPVEEER